MIETTNKRSQALNEFYGAHDLALFDSDMLALVLDCSRYTLERNRWAGRGVPFIKIGRSVRYRKADVLAWLEQRKPCLSTSRVAV